MQQAEIKMNSHYFILFVMFFGMPFFAHSQPARDHSRLNINQKKILRIYVSKFMSEKNQQLYYQSVSKKSLINALKPPLTFGDFQINNPYNAFHKPKPKSASLFSKQEFKKWGSQISAYKQMKWMHCWFPDSLKFIRDEEILPYRQKGSMPPPGHPSINIHYISTPFIYQGQTALMFAGTSKKATSRRSYYLYFIKKHGKWCMKFKGPLSIIY